MRKWPTSSRTCDRFVELIVALALGVVVVVAGERRAAACMNATMSESTAIAELKAAEAALDEGDVLTARQLAHDVGEVYGWMAAEYGRGFSDRATRIEALSFVRDPKADEVELGQAVSIFRNRLTAREEEKLPTDPALLADYGETLERDGQAAEAYDVLEPLAERDLIGSAYAYAAFARAAKWKHEDTWAATAQTRCFTMATNPSPCRGEYPRAPFVRGEPLHFALAAMVFLALALVRLVRKPRPWAGWAARGLGIAIVCYGVAAFALVNWRYESVAGIVAVGIFTLLGVLQRGLWIGAVQDGKVPGFAIRPLTDEDPPAPTLWFLDQFDTPAVIERVGGATYRESARQPVLFHLRRKKLKFSHVLLLAVAVLFAGCAGLVGLTARSR